MDRLLDRAVAHLADLVAYAVVGGAPNLDLCRHVGAFLDRHAVPWRLDVAPDGARANLFATVGPPVDGGVILSGHLDVVPADPATWTTPPLALSERRGRLYGRGALDMKGFIACCLAAVPAFAAVPLARPLHLALTFDEETGSEGARQFVPFLQALPFRPAVAIVGEPTGMRSVIGHKAGHELVAEAKGLAGHASRPEAGVNAVYAAARFVALIEATARRLAEVPRPGSPFDPPYTTLSVGTIAGGLARNVVPDRCRVAWEVRPLPEEDGGALIEGLRARVAAEILPMMRERCPDAAFDLIEEAFYPGLIPEPDGAAMRLVRDLWTTEAPGVVSFGTDGGQLQRAGVSTVVLGPGTIERAHTVDEWIGRDELARCLVFLDRLRDALKRP